MTEFVQEKTCEEKEKLFHKEIGHVAERAKQNTDDLRAVDEKLNNLQRVVELTTQSMKTFVDASGVRIAQIEEVVEKDRHELQETFKELLMYLKTNTGAAAITTKPSPIPWETILKSKVVLFFTVTVCLVVLALVFSGVAHELLPKVIEVLGKAAK